MNALRLLPAASILVLAACEGMGTAAVVDTPAGGAAVADAGINDQLCERPDEPTGEIVNTGSGATAVIDTGAGPTNNLSDPDC